VACALALSATLDDSADAEILLVSTDPAPSLADALGVATRRWAYDSPEPVTGVPRLFAWQMDAAAAFESLRDRYREHIDTLFDRIMGRSVDIVHDRAVIRDLLSLAPPGIDELYALASLGDALAERRYARIIVDPAPTGHLLRLLELPAIAIDWSHRLMRLIMKYKDITGLADAAGDLVNFSRRTRTLDTLLHDATRAGVVLVTLNEPAVIAETTRLASALQRVTVGVLGEIWNRVESEHGVVNGGQALRAKSASNETPIIQAPEHSGPLVGVEVIRAWSRHWMLRPPRASI
jgi:arsenite-transporting ATPase